MDRMPSSLLLVAGAEDVPLILAITHWMHHAVKGSREIIFPHVAHMLNMEIPAVFNKAVSNFLDTK
jgi:pimeloyl-ACP methyl ester carboxylesterase